MSIVKSFKLFKRAVVVSAAIVSCMVATVPNARAAEMSLPDERPGCDDVLSASVTLEGQEATTLKATGCSKQREGDKYRCKGPNTNRACLECKGGEWKKLPARDCEGATETSGKTAEKLATELVAQKWNDDHPSLPLPTGTNIMSVPGIGL